MFEYTKYLVWFEYFSIFKTFSLSIFDKIASIFLFFFIHFWPLIKSLNIFEIFNSNIPNHRISNTLRKCYIIILNKFKNVIAESIIKIDLTIINVVNLK